MIFLGYVEGDWIFIRGFKIWWIFYSKYFFLKTYKILKVILGIIVVKFWRVLVLNIVYFKNFFSGDKINLGIWVVFCRIC